MFGIDFSEILVIFGIALVVLGPEKLPKLAATIGRWIGRARAMARQFREQLEQEANSVHHGVDLGPEFGRGPIRPAAPAAAAGQPPPASANGPDQPAHTVPTDGVPPEGVASGTSASPALPDELTLADTHPAGLHPPAPTPAPAAAPAPAAPAAGTSPASSSPPEPQQHMFWPPDGAL